jgi:hypothetical protein
MAFAALIPLIAGLVQTGIGAYQKNRAKKKYDSIGDVNYTIPQEYFSNVGLAQKEASYGFSPQIVDYFTQGLGSGLAASTNAALQAGGSVNDFNKLYSNYTGGLKELAIANESVRESKIKALMNAKEALARERTQEWTINAFRKNQDQKAAAAAWINQSNATMNQGINNSVQGAVSASQYYLSNKKMGVGDTNEPEVTPTQQQPTFYLDPNQNNQQTITPEYLQDGGTQYEAPNWWKPY